VIEKKGNSLEKKISNKSLTTSEHKRTGDPSFSFDTENGSKRSSQ